MVTRMRIYESQNANHIEADRVFYQLVKPVHERHGAKFIGRYRDPNNRIIVLWCYENEDVLKQIQIAVAADPETLKHREERLMFGLHNCVFDESMLISTEPVP